jgi:polysaccharide biosynthesis/export protein
MQNKRIYTLLILIFFFIAVHLFTNIGQCQEQTSPAQAISPDAQAIKAELQKSGINLTPEEIQKGKEMLEKRDKPLTEAEIQKGKELLEKREKGQMNKPPSTNKSDQKENVTKESEAKTADKTTTETKDEDSLFSRTRKVGKYQDISLNLNPFGYQFFHDAADASSGRKDIPVDLKSVV